MITRESTKKNGRPSKITLESIEQRKSMITVESVIPLGSKGMQLTILSKSRNQATMAVLASTMREISAKLMINIIKKLSTTQVPNQAVTGSPHSKAIAEASGTALPRSGEDRKTILATTKTYTSIKMNPRAIANTGVIRKLKPEHSGIKRSKSRWWSASRGRLSPTMPKKAAQSKRQRSQACNGSVLKRDQTQLLPNSQCTTPS